MKDCDCLKDLIKIRGLCEDNVSCELYLDDLPNISREAFANFTNADRICVQDVFESIETAAIAATIGRLKALLTSKLGRLRPEKRVVSGQFRKTGVVELSDSLCGRSIPTGLSDYQEAHIDSVMVYQSAPTAISNIYVFDLFTGGLIDVIEYEAVQGCVNEVEINQSYNSKKGIWIAYDRRNVESKEVEYFNPNDCGCKRSYCSTCTSCSSDCCDCVQIAPDWDSDADKLFVHGDCLDTGKCGMIICYKQRCSFEAMICANKELVCYLLWYQMGITFYQDNRITKQVNHFTTMSDKVREAILSNFQAEYDNHLAGFIEAFEPDGFCFRCKGTRKVIARP